VGKYEDAKRKITKIVAKGGERATEGEQGGLEAEARKHGAELKHEENPGLPTDVVKAALERDNWTCVVCETKNNPLTVHHVRYSHEPGEPNEKATSEGDLNTVCTACHDGLHDLKRERMSEEGGEDGAHLDKNQDDGEKKDEGDGE
jgi:hypothetical protein